MKSNTGTGNMKRTIHNCSQSNICKTNGTI